MKKLLMLLFLVLPIQANAERILALSPHACEILSAIGAADEIVGVVEYCDYPESLASLPNLGGHNRIQVESAISLKPTLAVVMNDGTKSVKKLRRLGVNVVASNPTTIDSMLVEIRRLGVVSGHEKEAERLVSQLDFRLKKLGRLRTHEKIPVFYEIWSNPLIAAGGSSLIHDVLVRVGLRNVFGHIPMEGPKVNVEAVVRAKPELIIIPAKQQDISRRKKFWKHWLGKDIQVVSVSADLLHRPTPRIIDGMEELMHKLAHLPLQHAAYDD